MNGEIEIYEDEDIAVFIDATTTHTAVKNMGWVLDYKRMREWFGAQARLYRASFYMTIDEGGEEQPVIKLLDWMEFHGYTVHRRRGRAMIDGAEAARPKSNMDIEIAVDMLQLPAKIDHVLLFSGTGAFVPVVRAVQNSGKKVTVFSTMEGKVVSDSLRRQADQFVDLAKLKDQFERAKASAA